jgi:hypothetical protein
MVVPRLQCSRSLVGLFKTTKYCYTSYEETWKVE